MGFPRMSWNRNLRQIGVVINHPSPSRFDPVHWVRAAIIGKKEKTPVSDTWIKRTEYQLVWKQNKELCEVIYVA